MRRRREQTGALLELLWHSEEINEAKISETIQANFRTRYWAPTATAFNGARDNGDFAAINDIELQKALVYYFDVLETFLLERRLAEQEVREQFVGQLNQEAMVVPDKNFLSNNTYSLRLTASLEEIKENQALNNALVRYHRTLTDLIKRINFGKESLAKLRDRIEAHLVQLEN